MSRRETSAELLHTVAANASPTYAATVPASSRSHVTIYDTTRTIRYDARCYFNVRSKADTSRLNLPHGTDN